MSLEIDKALWADVVQERYGCYIEPWQFYCTDDGKVYAGSEFVAQLGDLPQLASGNGLVKFTQPGLSLMPSDARAWTASIAHMPRRGTGTEVAYNGDGIDRKVLAFRALYVGDTNFDFTGLSPDRLDARCLGCGELVPCNEDGILEHLKGRPRCEREVATA